jgi:acetyl-CoA carboxylase biotin carboxyl carrier protein
MDPNELNELRELVEFLKSNDVAEFDLEKNELKVRLKFMGAVKAEAAPASSGLDLASLARLMAAGSAPPAAPAPAQVASVHGVAESAPAVPAAAPAAAAEKLHTVKSPIVGTFYESPSPGSPAFVKVGDMVEVGQVLCIVEAMKLMNEIEADAAGEIVERIASTGQPVEYGQPLFSIRAK